MLSVHAHPDDEASKGASTMARYHGEGVHTVLVCCTGGEAGDILNPAADPPEARGTRTRCACRSSTRPSRIIGYDALYLLGYHDSGMPDTEDNARPDNFANATSTKPSGAWCASSAPSRPQVIITYGDDQSGYPHPDHIRVHEISVPAFDARRRPRVVPRSRRAVAAAQAVLLRWLLAPRASRRCTTGSSSAVRRARTPSGSSGCPRTAPTPPPPASTSATSSTVGRAALLAHRTQVAPNGFWFRVPLDVAASSSLGGLRARPLARRARRPRGRVRDRSVRGRAGPQHLVEEHPHMTDDPHGDNLEDLDAALFGAEPAPPSPPPRRTARRPRLVDAGARASPRLRRRHVAGAPELDGCAVRRDRGAGRGAAAARRECIPARARRRRRLAVFLAVLVLIAAAGAGVAALASTGDDSGGDPEVIVEGKAIPTLAPTTRPTTTRPTVVATAAPAAAAEPTPPPPTATAEHTRPHQPTGGRRSRPRARGSPPPEEPPPTDPPPEETHDALRPPRRHAPPCQVDCEPAP